MAGSRRWSESMAERRFSQKLSGMESISEEKPIPDVYPVIDTDLARDNVENDLTAADLQDL